MAMTALRASAVGDWEACGDCFYARELLHEMSWEEMDLETKRVAAAPFAGPIATIRDEGAMVVIAAGASMRPVARIFTAAGAPLGSFVWESKGRLVGWGWSEQLQLVVVEDTGLVSVRSLKGTKVREFSMGAAVEAEGVAVALVWAHGVVVLTQAMHVWAVLGFGSDSGRPPVRLADPPIASDMKGSVRLEVLDPAHTLSGGIEVLVACGSSVWQVDEVTCVEHNMPGRAPPPSITLMRASPDGAFLAVHTADARVLVLSTDFSRQLSEFETRADTPPVGLDWCGSDAVVVQWPELLLVIGPAGDHVSWPLVEGKVVLVTEVDGVRLVGNTRHELVRKVPSALAEVFRPGSTSPGTQLWDARDMLEAGLARADKALRLLGDQLPAAVMACIEAAAADMNIARQKALLRAAAFGHAFCPATSIPPYLTHDTAHKLRLLNVLRSPEIGLPLTAAQLGVLGLPAVIGRLVLLEHWLLAFRVAASLRHASPTLLQSQLGTGAGGPGPAAGVPKVGEHAPTASSLSSLAGPGASSSSLMTSGTSLLTPGGLLTEGIESRGGSTGPGPLSAAAASAALQAAVAMQWAAAVISAAAAGRGTAGSLSDVELKDHLMTKLRGVPGVRYAPLAAHAQSAGRRRLAIKLLEEESSCALQVPLLLSLAAGQGAGGGQGELGELGGEQDGGEGADEDAYSRALRKAIESGDTEVVYLVLFHIYRSRTLQDFWQLVSTRTLGRNLFIRYCRSKEPELLETIFATTGQATDLAELQVKQALSAFATASAAAGHEPGAGGNEAALGRLVNSLTEASHKYATSRDHLFQSKAVSDMAALRKEQARLEREVGSTGQVVTLVGGSVSDTLQQLLRHGFMRQALALKKMFGVSDKRFCWLRIRVLCDARDWEGLDAMAGERKTHPVGWEAFIETAKKYGATRDVLARLIARTPDSPAKADLYTSIDCAREAAEVAARLRDTALFTRIQQAVSAQSPAGLAIAQIRERLLAGGGR